MLCGAATPPEAANVKRFCETVRFSALPACEMVTTCPPTLMVPLRGEKSVFTPTLKDIVPGPVPLAPETMLMKPELELAAQVHNPKDVPTWMLPVPPVELNVKDDGSGVMLQAWVVPASRISCSPKSPRSS